MEILQNFVAFSEYMNFTYSREKIQVMLDWLTKGSLSMLVTVARASKAFVPLKKNQERKGFETYSIQSHARYEKISRHITSSL